MSTDIAAVVAYAHEAGHLKHIPRTGWLLAGVRAPESVAEHSFRVGVLAYLIAHLEGADPDRAASLGLFHDMPETRTSDVPSVGKPYLTIQAATEVAADQTTGLGDLAGHIIALISEHESAKTTNATAESLCSRDADKLECLLQAREYEREGYTQLGPWITSSADTMRTTSGKKLAAAALEVSPSQWWSTFAENHGKASA